MEPLVVGRTVVHRIVDADGLRFGAADILPDATPEAFAAAEGLDGSWDPATFEIVMAFGGYLVESDGRRILVDTGVGVGKTRAARPSWDHRTSDAFLRGLAAAGAAPGDVDVVVSTHLHADQVGWNTVPAGDGWAPTFPNARYLFVERELGHWRDRHSRDPGVNYGSFTDSVLPVLEAGLADPLRGDVVDLTPDVALHVMPGHTPGSCAVRIGGRGGAVVAGDLLHHPVQVTHPGWSSRFCCDAGGSARAREALLASVTDTGAVVLAAHFATQPAVRIVSSGGSRIAVPA